MKRRESLQSLGIITSHVLFPGILASFISSCQDTPEEKKDYKPLFFDEESFNIIARIIDIIIPATSTQSASETFAHHFMDQVFAKCLEVEQQAQIKDGIAVFIPLFSKTENQENLIRETDQKAFSGETEFSWFIPIKQYALIGFFTSREGTTKASNYVKVPGEYQGDIPLKENTLNYGKTSLRYYL